MQNAQEFPETVGRSKSAYSFANIMLQVCDAVGILHIPITTLYTLFVNRASSIQSS